jgi:DNA-binding LytR/AlgR family response regulator
MMNAIIIEDEKRASEHLASVLREIEPEISILTTLQSVKQSVAYLSAEHPIDLIFSDVQLADGLSFTIFNSVNVIAPVIFVTGYDRFMMDAFESNGIDYLLKPISRQELIKALTKYKNLKKHFIFQESDNAFRYLMQHVNGQKRTRIIARKGIENISIPLCDVVLFFTENKIVYVLDKWGKKYMTDKNLTDLETELDRKVFFRANRQYLLNINYIKGFKSYERVKLWVELNINDNTHPIIVSQETAPLFRRWLLEA